MTSYWFLGNFIAFFDGFYHLCQNFSPFEAFLRKLILMSNDVILTIFVVKRRHNDVTPILFRFLLINFFLQLFRKFQPHWSFFRKLEGGSILPPPNLNRGYSHPNSYRVKLPANLITPPSEAKHLKTPRGVIRGLRYLILDIIVDSYPLLQ